MSAMGKKVAIVQSNYIPWKGYFDLIHAVDEFILFDDMQYTRRDWRNRNRIKTANGPAWLTIPVVVKGRYLQRIADTVVSDPSWSRLHWKTIVHHYSKTPYFRKYGDMFEQIYREATDTYLSAINHRFLVAICELLGIRTKVSWSSAYPPSDGKTERLVHLCKCTGAGEYVSGPSARAYLVPRLFEEADISLQYFSYEGYPEYRQLFPPFDHAVSIIDLIFNEGPDASRYLLTFK